MVIVSSKIVIQLVPNFSSLSLTIRSLLDYDSNSIDVRRRSKHCSAAFYLF